MTINGLGNGADGKMGQEAVAAISEHPELGLVAKTDRNDNLVATIQNTKAQVVVDLTNADVVYENALEIISSGAHPVIGTSGLLPEQILELQHICESKKLGGLIVPNFSIGAVLMMKYAQDAMQYMQHAEIIELHHDKKLDSPSGTAVKTAQMLNEINTDTKAAQGKELLTGSRGATQGNIHIHSVRLPGLVAHQEVIFGGHHETLTIRHDSLHRKAFMPGVCLACQKVTSLQSLLYGLENIL